MKKIFLAALIATISLAACQNQNTEAPAEAQDAATEQINGGDIAYVRVEYVMAESEIYKTEGVALQEKTEKASKSWAQKEKNLQYEQAKREKAMAIMNATLNAAAAIIASLAQSPIAIGPIPNPAGIASLALATTMGVVQVAAAMATPLPKFATGGIVGGSDYNDGIVARISSGEMVLTKGQQTQLFDALSSSNNSDNATLGFNYEAMAAANAALPAPVMDYTEFKEFGEKVSTYNEIAKV